MSQVEVYIETDDVIGTIPTSDLIKELKTRSSSTAKNALCDHYLLEKSKNYWRGNDKKESLYYLEQALGSDFYGLSNIAAEASQ